MPVVDFRGANGLRGHQPYPINHNLRKVAFLEGNLSEPYMVSPPNFFFKPPNTVGRISEDPRDILRRNLV